MKKDLTQYRFPEDLKNMSDEEMELLSYAIREFLIEHVSKTGGHLASNLGVVELTIALHKILTVRGTKSFGMSGINPMSTRF